jgi:putative transposase
MAKSKFSEVQIVQILREAESTPLTIEDFCKKHKIGTVTFYRWKNRFGALQVDEAKRLRQMEAENNRLKKLLAERDLEVSILKEINAKKW